MKEHELGEFTIAWTGAAVIYGYEKKLTDTSIETIFEVLRHLELADIKRAINAHIRNPDAGRFMPKPADIVRHIEGDSDSRELAAWTKASDAVRLVGSYKSVVFDDPLVMCCVADMGGWITFCAGREDGLSFKRNEFVKRYRGYLNKTPEKHPTKLIGRIERDNTPQYLSHIPEPVLIGNQEAALAVYEGGDAQKMEITPLNLAKSRKLTSRLRVVSEEEAGTG